MSSSAEAQSHPGTGTHAWNRRARFFNSGNAFALELSPVPSVSFIAERDRAFAPVAPSGLIDMDLSAWVVQDGGLHYHARTTGFAYAN